MRRNTIHNIRNNDEIQYAISHKTGPSFMT